METAENSQPIPAQQNSLPAKKRGVPEVFKKPRIPHSSFLQRVFGRQLVPGQLRPSFQSQMSGRVQKGHCRRRSRAQRP
ncbi:hypothetical protein TNIN_255671 [Trichonephila inaurata madagascariensis]|uniref:Uncharacterized protein n=1 Tax=Trichonephila inaurata madagascariensis TaxID=2747483 RepID=A0A8X7C9D5_9ARAC|nr:hypothetical protein TNIN_255671 [Trichonephila inaurata madagascariensis]